MGPDYIVSVPCLQFHIQFISSASMAATAVPGGIMFFRFLPVCTVAGYHSPDCDISGTEGIEIQPEKILTGTGGLADCLMVKGYDLSDPKKSLYTCSL